MENDLFVQLLKLYKNSSENTPTEDFTTEVLAGVLQSDESLLDQFVNEVLCVQGSGFTVETQQKSDNSIIDMVFQNHESICFVENKVESSEGYGQLSKYASILSQLDNGKDVFLTYCTKYYDPKNASDIEPLPLEKFKQFRWTDVFNFCKGHQDNLLVKPFVEYLKELGMSSIPEFDLYDLMAMQQFRKTIQKIDDFFEKVKPQFIEYFGEPYERDDAKLKDFSVFNRYALLKRYNESSSSQRRAGNYLEILLGFNFKEEKSPSVCVLLFCTKSHNLYEQFKESCQRELSKFELSFVEFEHGYVVLFEKSLADFISSDRQYQEITDWFIQHMEAFRNFKEATPELEW